ncbi:MAG: rod-binding protein [Rhodospirillales bacterium]
MNEIGTLQANLAYQHNAAKAPEMPAKDASYGQMKKVAEDFEAFFLAQALAPMFNDIEPEAPFGGGPGEDIWRSMQVQEYGKAIAKQGGVGIADHVLEQMIRLQEGN